MTMFNTWYRDTDIRGLLRVADKQLAEDFFNDHLLQSKEWYEIDLEYMKNFKYFPEDFDSVRNLIIKIIEAHLSYMLSDSFPDVSYILIGRDKMNEQLIEPVLDVLEDWPMCGVVECDDAAAERKFFIETVSFFDKESEKWVIEPNEEV